MKEFFDKFFKFQELSTGDMTTATIVIISVILGLIIIGSIVAFFVLRAIGKPSVITTKDLTYGAVCLAASYALSFIGIRLPQGGSVTICSLLPIMIYCYYFGFSKGCVVCVAYTILQFFQGAVIVSPFSAILDYVIPYLSLIFVGMFSYNKEKYAKAMLNKKKPLSAHSYFFIGSAIYVVVRYISHVLSGVIFYGEYAMWGLSALPYSMIYNLFCVIDAAFTIAAATALLSSKNFNAFMASSAHALQKPNAAKENN